jgi:hypothetical protein
VQRLPVAGRDGEHRAEDRPGAEARQAVHGAEPEHRRDVGPPGEAPLRSLRRAQREAPAEHLRDPERDHQPAGHEDQQVAVAEEQRARERGAHPQGHQGDREPEVEDGGAGRAARRGSAKA